MKLAPSIFVVVIASCCLSCSRTDSRDYPISKELDRLDRILSERPSRDEQKLLRIKTLTSSLKDGSISSDSRQDIYASLVDEYNAYQFDSVVHYLEQQNLYAKRVGNDEVVSSSTISLASKLALAGYYLEAYDILHGVDTTSLSDASLRSYYLALAQLSEALESTSGSLGGYRQLESEAYYMEKTLEHCDYGTDQWKVNRLRLYNAQKNYSKADMAADEILSVMENGTRRYGAVAYLKSIACDNLGKEEEKLLWEIRSAQSDLTYLNRDYTSLIMVARDIASDDPERSFRYIQRSMEDALYYNGRFRSDQILKILPDIQKSLEDRRVRGNNFRRLFEFVMLFFAFLLSVLLVTYVRLYKQQSRIKASLTESNALRERYIIDFLYRQAEWIESKKRGQSAIVKKLRLGKYDELIKELSISRMSESDMEGFYELFDRTFLGLYPNFVESFNALLVEDARFDLGPDPQKVVLPTELRVYALIRLGIEDATEIARLLNYSVRTIYNYKVKMRNASILPKDEFDARVRTLCS